MKLIQIIIILLALAVLAGCASLDNWAAGNEQAVAQAIDAVKVVGAIAAPATGGYSALIASLAAILIPSFFAVNRAIVAHRRKKAIEEINDDSGTPDAADLVKTTASRKAVRAITG